MFLGIDLGTSGIKVVLIDDAHRVLGTGHARLSVQTPQPGWSEQDPQAWIDATRAAIADLAMPLDRVAGIGLSGQMHGAVCLDAADHVLRPAILWNDGRASDEAEALDADPQFRAVTGNIVFAGFTAPKLVWMQRHEPDLFARIRRVLLPKDYLRLWLTGEAISDMSDASGTAWFDPSVRDWSAPLLAATGMRREQMPDLAEGSAVAGHLRAHVAAELGMPAGIPVAGGAGDNAATAIGAGITGTGPGLVSLGTSGVIFAATDRFLPAPDTAIHAFCHALPDQWHQMGVILSAASCLDWWAGIIGRAAPDLLAELDPQPGQPGRIAFWPYLTGERTPLNDPAQRAGFTGMSARTDRRQLTRAVLEGVTLALAENMQALRAAGGGADALIAMGGGARSDLWLAMLAQATGVPVLRPAGAETGAGFGAARLALMAATGAGAEVLTTPDIAGRFDPDPALLPAWAEALARLQAQRA
ncbi:xylulokinase [Paracoccus spongiarum]|uniref:Xylulose kinase n=1 Tax=Paracoccus spongiarum TaxID=3064387 RepID=A0ABT9JDD4_9RHOB|nr:xylulokinase [Paracoccus sp. 2205BS29-5]MDP5307822.1 xylulokinase [Paracoccus sp. 2205BS29-5]